MTAATTPSPAEALPIPPASRRGPIAAVATFAVLFLAYVAVGFVFPPEVPTISSTESMIYKYYTEGGSAPPVMYFGSSAARENSNGAQDKRTLADLFAEDLKLDPQKAVLVAYKAFHPVVYRAVMESLRSLPSRPRLIVVPVEMRYFSTQWTGHPMFQHEALIASLKQPDTSLARRVLSALRLTPREGLAKKFQATPRRMQPQAGPPVPIYGREALSWADYDRLLINSSLRGRPMVQGSAWDEKMDLQFRAHYLYDLDERHPFLKALVDIGRIGRELGITIVYDVAPVNVEDLRHYTGADAQRLEDNVRLVIDTLRRAGERHIVDSHELLPSGDFSDKNFTCEHMTIEGRSLRAKAIADYVRREGLADELVAP